MHDYNTMSVVQNPRFHLTTALNEVITKLIADLSKQPEPDSPLVPVEVEKKTDLPPRKDNYHSNVLECLKKFDELPLLIDRKQIIEKAQRILDHTTKNHPELVKTDDPIPPKYKDLVGALSGLDKNIENAFRCMIKTFFEVEIPVLPKSTESILYKYGDVVVPCISVPNNHNYPLDLPIQQQNTKGGFSEFKKFGDEETGNTLTSCPQYIRLPDLWEVVAFIVSQRQHTKESLIA